jgi:hypothetical protein
MRCEEKAKPRRLTRRLFASGESFFVAPEAGEKQQSLRPILGNVNLKEHGVKPC